MSHTVPLHLVQAPDKSSDSNQDWRDKKGAEALFAALLYLVEGMKRATSIIDIEATLTTDIEDANTDTLKLMNKNINDEEEDIDLLIKKGKDPYLYQRWQDLNAQLKKIDDEINHLNPLDPNDKQKYQDLMNQAQDIRNQLNNLPVDDQGLVKKDMLSQIVAEKHTIYNKLNQDLNAYNETSQKTAATPASSIANQTSLIQSTQSVGQSVASVENNLDWASL